MKQKIKIKVKKSKLEQLLGKLPKTNAYLLEHGYKTTEKQLFIRGARQENIKNGDRAKIAKAIALDLLSWNISELQLNFTKNNGKLRTIGSIAFSPFLTCMEMPCFLNGTCYGMFGKYRSFFKFFYQIENTILYGLDKKRFIKQFNAYLDITPLKRFRFFENGDFVDSKMVEAFASICKKHKKIEFLAMTKKASFVNEYLDSNKLPKNFFIRLSEDSYDKKPLFDNPHHLPLTDIVKSKEDKKPGWFICPGTKVGCDLCHRCWSDDNIAFVYHP